MEGLLSFFFVIGWAYLLPCHLCWNDVPIDLNNASLGNQENNCLNVVEHVTSDEK